MKSTLENDNSQAEANRIEKELKEQTEPVNKNIQILERIQAHLETAIIENTDLQEAKENIKTFAPELYTEL
ncbi:MAG: hypothetical protein LBJ14_08165 [Desulfarculales bacterium]|nr:hypothetical protein [Desulfarculales bacterium]